MKYDWYTPEREIKYPTSFQVDFVGQSYEGACYYRITRCPICLYCKDIGVEELMPPLCDLDHEMIHLQHSVLHRQQTIASGGAYCDYYITGDRENHGGPVPIPVILMCYTECKGGVSATNLTDLSSV